MSYHSSYASAGLFSSIHLPFDLFLCDDPKRSSSSESPSMALSNRLEKLLVQMDKRDTWSEDQKSWSRQHVRTSTDINDEKTEEPEAYMWPIRDDTIMMGGSSLDYWSCNVRRDRTYHMT